jgi:predicted RNA-binding Zn-ribbon protein involved in translation (DUF1610 family)
VEGAVTETWDTEGACGRLGVPLSTHCRLCGRGAEGRATVDARFPAGCPACGADLDDESRAANRCPMCGASAALVETAPARALAGAAELEAGLQAWAREEGLSSARELLESAFVLGTIEAVHAALVRGERIETTFDVADLLFGSGSGGGGGDAIAVERDEKPPSTQRMRPPPSIRRYGGALDELLALASVAAADGEANAGDLGALERAAQARGLPPLPLHEVRVRRPGEIDPPPTLLDRERVLEEMFQMAWADGQMDESELKVIREYSRVWGIDPERLAEWTKMYTFADTGRIERWFRRFGQMIFPER